MRRTLTAAALVALPAGVLAVPALAATKSVAIGDNYFVRDGGTRTVTIERGDTVRFRFVGQIIHNATVTKGPAKFKSPTKTSGTYSKRLTRRGTYTIICTIHGATDQSMRLRVR